MFTEGFLKANVRVIKDGLEIAAVQHSVLRSVPTEAVMRLMSVPVCKVGEAPFVTTQFVVPNVAMGLAPHQTNVIVKKVGMERCVTIQFVTLAINAYTELARLRTNADARPGGVVRCVTNPSAQRAVPMASVQLQRSAPVMMARKVLNVANPFASQPVCTACAQGRTNAPVTLASRVPRAMSAKGGRAARTATCPPVAPAAISSAGSSAKTKLMQLFSTCRCFTPTVPISCGRADTPTWTRPWKSALTRTSPLSSAPYPKTLLDSS